MSAARVAPGGVLGILGGGQLGRMLALAAARLGIRCHVYCPDADSPAFDVAHRVTCASYDDEAALAAFAEGVDAVTYEFENIPSVAAAFLCARRPVLPDVKALDTTADRLTEKTFVRSLGIATAQFRPIDRHSALAFAIATLGRPAVLKTRRLGYDGKGQVIIRPGMDLNEALGLMGGRPAILEAFVPFAKEVSVVAVRGSDGEVRTYDLVENEHRDHRLDRSIVPARVAPAVEAAARDIAARVISALAYVGVLAVEMFVTREEAVLVNEIAPRVHNSGHWTIDACLVSQFENHVRAVCGWPLGSTARHSDAVMVNLIGDGAQGWPTLAAEPDTALHLYGKREVRPGRKMGHVTRITRLAKVDKEA
jgi:5-(carboxyamino)imidazole ribonucleotide synthase